MLVTSSLLQPFDRTKRKQTTHYNTVCTELIFFIQYTMHFQTIVLSALTGFAAVSTALPYVKTEATSGSPPTPVIKERQANNGG